MTARAVHLVDEGTIRRIATLLAQQNYFVGILYKLRCVLYWQLYL